MNESKVICILYIISSIHVVFGIQRIPRAREDQDSQRSDENIPISPDNITTVKESLRKQLSYKGVENYPRPRYNETNCICSRIYDPVCASNDRSYFNMCQFQCAMGNSNQTDIKVLYQGNCIPF